MATTNDFQQKPIHSLVLDAGPLIKNCISVSTIINSVEEVYTTPSVLSELRDETTRSRVQTTLMPFLKLRAPKPASYDAVVAFSKKTGDHAVLSRQDLEILALAYELHYERNSGNHGLRTTPGHFARRRPDEVPENKGSMKKLMQNEKKKFETATPAVSELEEQQAANDGWELPRGKRAVKSRSAKSSTKDDSRVGSEENHGQMSTGTVTLQEEIDQERKAPENHYNQREPLTKGIKDDSFNCETSCEDKAKNLVREETVSQTQSQVPSKVSVRHEVSAQDTETDQAAEAIEEDLECLEPSKDKLPNVTDLAISSAILSHRQPSPLTDSSDMDSDDDWITPSNLSTFQARDSAIGIHDQKANLTRMDVATVTTDFAMQNVLLQMNLRLVSTNMQRIKHLSTKVLRCHACFHIVKQMDKQFCPRCGQASLQRVSCSINAKGDFRIHLSKNYQWNTRGDKYSIPKPIHGTANGRWNGQGGGKGGWGRDLILAEDQKEYQRQMNHERRRKTRDLMDEDYIPSILGGSRSTGGGRPKVGAGKNVNSRKR